MAAPFTENPADFSQPESAEEKNGDEAAEPFASSVTLPETRLLMPAVQVSALDATSRLVGFQGDLLFDERVNQFADLPVQKAGLTAGNWNVSGNVLPGKGPIRTLRISAYSVDFTPLSGTGTLFQLNVVPVGEANADASLKWASGPDQFIFIDADLKRQRPKL